MINKFVYLVLFVFWGTCCDTPLLYCCFFFLLLVSLLYFIFIKKAVIFSFCREDYISLSFIAVWVYGLLLGLCNGNKIEYVFSNFAGMTCYGFYFIFRLFNLKISRMINVILVSAVTVSFISIYIWVYFFLFNSTPFWAKNTISPALNAGIRCLFATMNVIFPLFFSSLFLLFYSKVYYVNIVLLKKTSSFFILFLISLLSLVFVGASKGLMLAVIVFLLIIPSAFHLKRVLCGKMNYKMLYFVLFVVLFVIMLERFDYLVIFEKTFSDDDVANITRYDQLYYIVDDLIFIGKGLGAVIPGIIRDFDRPYGVELVYVNIVHKFGIFSLMLFVNWIYCACFLLKLLYNRIFPLYTIIALTSLGYLFSSLGNPLLFHPAMVVLNCFVLYYIRSVRLNYKLIK